MKGPWVGEGKNLTVLPVSPLAEIGEYAEEGDVLAG
jgi:hypothetical protein